MPGLIVIAVLIGLGAVLYLLRQKTELEEATAIPHAYWSNSNAFVDRGRRTRVMKRDGKIVVKAEDCDSPVYVLERSPVLNDVMNALGDPNTHLIGVYGSQDHIVAALIAKVGRRVGRDQLFGMVVTATVTKDPHVRKIQEDMARQLRLTFNHKSKEKRANELIRRIKNEQKILIVLCKLYKKLDLSKVGIPYGADHRGCKILLTASAENVLSNLMRTQKNFMV